MFFRVINRNWTKKVSERHTEDHLNYKSDSEEDPCATEADCDSYDSTFILDIYGCENSEPEEEIKQLEEQTENYLTNINISEDDVAFHLNAENNTAKSGLICSFLPLCKKKTFF